VLVQVKVQSLGLDRSTNDPVVILKEAEGPRVLPIWIGPGEASAIAIRLAGMEFPRPLTHDLLASVLAGLGGELRRVLITRMDNDTYFAELIIHRDGEVFSVDARPSDSIAVALRTDAGIFADESLLEHAQVDLSGAGANAEEMLGEAAEDSGEVMDPQALQDYLKKLNPEDFGRFTP
jgi:bifunctional DNase/RNase